MDSLVSWLGWLVAAVLAIPVVIRARIKFDINEWQQNRQQQRRARARGLCPHAYFNDEDGTRYVKSAYISPPGTLAYQCQLCRHVTHDDGGIQISLKYWANNPDKLWERIQKINKLFG